MLHEFEIAAGGTGQIWIDLTSICIVQPAGHVITKVVLANGMEYSVVGAAVIIVDHVREAHRTVDLRRRSGQPDPQVI